jgi:hypothetical protein
VQKEAQGENHGDDRGGCQSGGYAPHVSRQHDRSGFKGQNVKVRRGARGPQSVVINEDAQLRMLLNQLS